MEHNIRDGIGSTSRWLEAIWEPGANIYCLPGGIDMLDVSGDGDARFIAADIGTIPGHTAKLRVFKEEEQITEHKMTDVPCGIAGFYSENGDPKSTALAVGGGSSVYIFKNMKPHFKFCLPFVDAHPKEREIWHKSGLEEELNVLSLGDDLELLLKEIGAGCLTPRTLKFLSLDASQRQTFAEKYRRVPLIKANVVTTIGTIRKDSWNDVASSYIIVGTESGEILVLDSKGFFAVDKHVIGWPPVAVTSTGLWTGDGKIVIIGRDGKLGAIKRGSPIKHWECLPAPAVSICPLGDEGIAVALMDGTLYGFSRTGNKLWRIGLPGFPLDLVSIPVPQSGLSLLAVSIAKLGVRVYDEKHHVDTIKMMDSVSAMKYGRMGQEERAMGMVTVGGGLNVKILKRTANFCTRTLSNFSSNIDGSKFAVPKKTKLFVEQTIRERSEATEIHKSFQEGLLRLKLAMAKKVAEISSTHKDEDIKPITLQASVLGLGPNYVVRVLVTNVADGLSCPDLFLLFRDENADIEPRVIRLPLLSSGFPVPVSVDASPRGRLPGKVIVVLCKRGRQTAITTTTAILPVPEEDLEV